MRGRAGYLEGRIQRRKISGGTCRQDCIDKGALVRSLDNGRPDARPASSIVGPKSGGHSASQGGTVLVMESAHGRDGDDVAPVESLDCAGFPALLGQGQRWSGFEEWVTTQAVGPENSSV